MPIESGKHYVFINKRSGTALDVDTRDNRTVQGWTRHGGANQQWEAIKQSGSDNWRFKNIGSGGNLGRTGMTDGDRIISGAGIFNWTIELQRGTGENVYRIVSSGSSKCIDLANGSSANGTRVQIWQSSLGNPNQTWEAQQV